MNIAHLLPYGASFPLKKHNGRYEWVLRLANLQAKAGHQVTIYAAPGSYEHSSEIHWKSQPVNRGGKLENNKALLQVAFGDTSHDIFHSHFDSLHYIEADKTDKPVLFTQHWFPNEKIAQTVQFNSHKNVSAVAPTNLMAAENKKLGIPTIQVIPHGIDLSLFKPIPSPDKKRFIFVGRITKSKGVREAVELAIAAKVPIDIVGKINEADLSYWQEIEPLIDSSQVCYLGPKQQTEVAQLLAHARGLIFPMQKEEAFGQTIIEAQACGTPVIVGDIGASNELVDQGKSGFLANNTSEFLEAIHSIDAIDRTYCRRFAETFDIQRMVESYDKLYAQLVSKN